MDHGHPRRLRGYEHSRLASSDRQTLAQRLFILHRGGQAVSADGLQRSKNNLSKLKSIETPENSKETKLFFPDAVHATVVQYVRLGLLIINLSSLFRRKVTSKDIPQQETQQKKIR